MNARTVGLGHSMALKNSKRTISYLGTSHSASNVGLCSQLLRMCCHITSRPTASQAMLLDSGSNERRGSAMLKEMQAVVTANVSLLPVSFILSL